MNRFHRWYCRSGVWKKGLTQRILPWSLDGVELGQNLLEIGPGPGLTTDYLRPRFERLTSIEIDPELAGSLRQRLKGTNVTVIEGDATAMPFEDGSFSGAVSFTMLHHVPSPVLQDRLFAEAHRVLRQGGMFIGTDSTWSRALQLIHLWDTMVVVDPGTLAERLESAGFRDVSVDVGRGLFRFRARRV